MKKIVIFLILIFCFLIIFAFFNKNISKSIFAKIKLFFEDFKKTIGDSFLKIERELKKEFDKRVKIVEKKLREVLEKIIPEIKGKMVELFKKVFSNIFEWINKLIKSKINETLSIEL